MVKKKVAVHPKLTGPRVRKFTDFKDSNTLLARKWSPRGKENRNVKNGELEMAIIRSKMKLRMQHYETTLAKIDDNFACWKSFFLKFLTVVDETRLAIQAEREENMQLMQQLEVNFFPCNETLKTQTVSPMVKGLPLKRASIALKRLDPFNLQQRPRDLPVQNHRSRLPPTPDIEGELQDRRPSSVPNVSPRIENSGSEIMNTPSNQMVRPTLRRSAAPRHRRCDICLEVPPTAMSTAHSNSSECQQDIHLKRASIQLTRLDPSLYSCDEGDNSELDDSQNLREDMDTDSEDSDVKSERAENSTAEPSVAASCGENVHPGSSFNNMNFSKGPGRQNCCSDTSPNNSPMVVLERMEWFEYFARLGEGQNSQSLQAQCPPPCRRCGEAEDTCSNSEKVCKRTGIHGKNQMCLNEEISHLKPLVNKRQPLVSLIDMKGMFGNVEPVRKGKEECETLRGGTQPAAVPAQCQAPEKKKKNSESKIEERVVSETVQHKKSKKAVADRSKEQDPLEGPSWLYSGNKTPAQIANIKRRKKVNLSYPAICIDESSDESTYDDHTGPKYHKEKLLRERRKMKRKKHGKGLFVRKSSGRNS